MESTYAIEVQQRERTDTAVVHASCKLEEIPQTLSGIFSEVAATAARGGAQPRGVFGRYNPKPDGFDIEAGFTIDRPIQSSGRVEASELPGGECAVTLHVGSYDTIGLAYEAVQQWIAANGRRVAGAPWEVYLTGPEVQPPRTEVVFPLRPR